MIYKYSLIVIEFVLRVSDTLYANILNVITGGTSHCAAVLKVVFK